MPRHYSSESESSSSSSSESSCESESQGRKRKRQRDKDCNQKAKKHQLSENNSQGVYVLQNRHTNTVYVGKSENVEKRIHQHKQANQDHVLRRERTLTTGSGNDLESWERNEVLTRMYTEGMDNVRGWRYTRRGPLTTEEKSSARSDIMEKFDLCRRCGRNSHFANRCFAGTPAHWCKDVPM